MGVTDKERLLAKVVISSPVFTHSSRMKMPCADFGA
jgi:hypothetical protein